MKFSGEEVRGLTTRQLDFGGNLWFRIWNWEFLKCIYNRLCYSSIATGGHVTTLPRPFWVMGFAQFRRVWGVGEMEDGLGNKPA